MGKKWKGGEGKERRLLCISDLEGCANSPIMCKTDTFTAITTYLNDKSEYDNHVVFLGDYFDQGPYMMESINGIAGLLQNSEIKDKVHIILGNRDINKFRILYEAVTEVFIDTDKLDKIWSSWKGAPGNFESKYINLKKLHTDKVKKTLELNARTYGAPNLLYNILNEYAAYLSKSKQEVFAEVLQEYKKQKETPENVISLNDALLRFCVETYNIGLIDALYIICKIFVEEPIVNEYFQNDNVNVITKTDDYIKTFAKNARILFYHGKLISNFEIDTDKHVLMSHGGSYNKYIFNLGKNNESYYTDIQLIQKSNISKYSPNNYFEYMENFRKKFSEDALISEEKYVPNRIELIDIVKNINSIYNTFIQSIFDKDGNILVNYVNLIDSTPDFRDNYFILQSLGLAAGAGESGFVSPIASCGVVPRCGGTFEKTDDTLINQFSTLNIKCVVNGHVPHCVPVPIIYQRTSGSDSDKKRVVFVNCDTSNGNTPSNYTSLGMIPLAYVTKDKVGIASLEQLNNTNTENPLGLDRPGDKGNYYYTQSESDHNYYKDLINTWDYDKTPIIDNNSNLVVDDKIILKKDSKERMFAPLEIFQKTQGGRKRCSKKMIRKCKRMTKRMRTKMGCGHCC